MTRPREPQESLPIPMGGLGLLAIFALGLLGVGAYVDLPISQGLYTPDNMLGTILAAYGEAPALLALVAAGTLAWNANPPVHVILRWLLVGGGGVLIVVGTLALVVRPMEMWQLPVVVHLIIALAASALVIWGVTRAAWSATWQGMLVLGAALVVAVAAELVLVQIVKDFWERPRMRMLAETGAEFSPWWSPGYPEKDVLLAQGFQESEFASFPSGHTAHATVAVMLAGFAILGENLKKHRWLLFWIGAVWTLMVGLSRITIGAHFVSDTAAAMLIALACIAIVTVLANAILRSRALDRLVLADHSAHGAGG